MATTITITIEGDQHTISTKRASSDELLRALHTLKNGHFAAYTAGSFQGTVAPQSDGDTSGFIDAVMAQHQQFTVELKRLTQELGTEGVLGGQIELSGAEGDWRQLVEHINTMSANLTTQIRAIADVVEAAANGDHSRQLVVAASGETARLRDAVNRLNARLVAGDNTPQRATRNGVIDADMPKLSGANEVETTIEVFDEIEPGND